MNTASHNKLVSFIWSIADDCLRDVYVRGKYRDVILPMVVLRRLDALLEGAKDEVMEEVRFQREEAGFTELDESGLREASGYVFYNTSEWTLQRLHDTATNNQQILEANFKAYLDGFSENVKEIIKKFKLQDQVKHMANKDVLLDVLEKFTSPYINLTPQEKADPDGRKLPPLSNLGMGYVFEELIRRFNEENNEEAGEHFTPPRSDRPDDPPGLRPRQRRAAAGDHHLRPGLRIGRYADRKPELHQGRRGADPGGG